MPRGKPVHILSDINHETKTASCAKCGPNSPFKIKDKRPRCAEGIRLGNRTPQGIATKKKYNAERYKLLGDIRVYNHGLSGKEAKELRRDQVCAICGTDSNLCVDHDHTTKKLRGILCKKCNVGLGMFKDDQELLSRAIEYLKNPPLTIP